MGFEGLSDAKQAVRRSLLTARRSVDPAWRTAEAAALRRAAAALDRRWQRVCAFVPSATEPGDLGLVTALARGGRTVLLPVTTEDRDLDWVAYVGATRLRTGPYGVAEPVGEHLGRAAVRAVDAVLVPALAVDRRGVRLGRGAGCYDRALARVAGGGVPLVAVVRDAEVVDRLPEEPHDVRMTHVLTPGRGLVVVAAST